MYNPSGSLDFFIAYYDNRLFDEVYEGPLFISNKILLSHEPLMSNIGCYFNIHGHCHGEQEQFIDGLNVCCEKINFEPVNLEQLIKNGIVSSIKDIHRVTIDNASSKI